MDYDVAEDEEVAEDKAEEVTAGAVRSEREIALGQKDRGGSREETGIRGAEKDEDDDEEENGKTGHERIGAVEDDSARKGLSGEGSGTGTGPMVESGSESASRER